MNKRQKAGRKGGLATKKKHGTSHYQKAALKMWEGINKLKQQHGNRRVETDHS